MEDLKSKTLTSARRAVKAQLSYFNHMTQVNLDEKLKPVGLKNFENQPDKNNQNKEKNKT